MLTTSRTYANSIGFMILGGFGLAACGGAPEGERSNSGALDPGVVAQSLGGSGGGTGAGGSPPTFPPTPQHLTWSFKNDNPSYVTAICVGWIDGTATPGKYCLGSMRIPGSTAPPPATTNVESTSVFRIGSVTKLFGGALLAAKKIQGSRAYTDPVVNWIIPQGLSATDPKRTITLEMLAQHASGFPKNPTTGGAGDTMDVWNSFTTTPLNTGTTIGLQYDYSNMGFAVLGTALSDYNFYTGVTDTWDEQLDTDFFVPLGMVDTKLAISSTVRDSRVPEVSGWALDEGAVNSGGLAGQYHSTIDEMLTYLQWNMKQITLGNSLDAVVDEVHVEHDHPCYSATAPNYKSGTCRVGLAWQISFPSWLAGTATPKLNDKNGSLSYFRSYIAHTDDKGVVVLVAGHGPPEGVASPTTLGRDILQAL